MIMLLTQCRLGMSIIVMIKFVSYTFVVPSFEITFRLSYNVFNYLTH